MKLIEVPYISIDPLKMALVRSVPTYQLNPDGTSVSVSEELWPFISTLILNCVETGVEYIVEGEMLPKHVHELSENHGVSVDACFVGYKDISADEKVAQIRKHTGHPNDWTSGVSDAELYALIEEGIQYSEYLSRECHTYGIRYIDFSTNFDEGKTETLAYLAARFQARHQTN
ncbi:hypothetical protein [Gynuella sunshinyii]|nr:hypothetical protein [Gynuella sunshinyii]